MLCFHFHLFSCDFSFDLLVVCKYLVYFPHFWEFTGIFFFPGINLKSNSAVAIEHALYVFGLLNLWRLVLRPSVRSVMVNVPCAFERLFCC